MNRGDNNMYKLVRCHAKPRSDIFDTLENSADQLVEHLVKIAMFQDNGNLKHWVDELGGFVNRIPKIKGKNQPPLKDFIYRALTEYEYNRLDATIENVEFLYKKVKPVTTSKRFIKKYIDEYMKWLSEELSEKGFVYASKCSCIAQEILDKYINEVY